MTFSKPVLFLIFNRPEFTFQSFKKIKELRPSKLYIAADGPRKNKSGEKEKCDLARSIVKDIDWPCDIKTLFRDNNLGCKLAVSSAIDWLFTFEEDGIILEDDCAADATFFQFCEKMLERYKTEDRIMMICGSNYLYGSEKYPLPEFENSYFFSDYYPIWGWATWKRAWNFYNVDISSWESKRKRGDLYWLFPIKRLANHYKGMFDIVQYEGFNTWDIQWWYACIFNNGLSIVPKYNLIQNIGSEGVHTATQGQSFLNMPVIPLDCETLKHPDFIYPQYDYNLQIYKIIGVLKTPWQLLKHKTKVFVGKKLGIDVPGW